MPEQWPDAPGNESDYQRSDLEGDQEDSEQARIEWAVDAIVKRVEDGADVTTAVAEVCHEADLQHAQAVVHERVEAALEVDE